MLESNCIESLFNSESHESYDTFPDVLARSPARSIQLRDSSVQETNICADDIIALATARS